MISGAAAGSLNARLPLLVVDPAVRAPPLIVYVPNIQPRKVPGAVSPLDLVPTLVDLCGLVLPAGAELEGESLVPQLFYTQDAHRRVVFAETNAPRPLRAAI